MRKTKKISITIVLFFLAGTVFLLPKSGGVEIGRLSYGDENVRLDVYNPKKADCPVVILIHGAAGISGDRAVRYNRFAGDLMREGIIAINVHYFDSKRKNWLRTILRTIDYASTIDNADKERIGLIGYSLGGTIALKAAALDRRIKLLVVNAGYMPKGFSKKDAAQLPETYMIAGTADTAVNTLRQIEAWFGELDKPFQAKIDAGYGHSIPVTMFWQNWETIVSFVSDRFGANR